MTKPNQFFGLFLTKFFLKTQLNGIFDFLQKFSYPMFFLINLQIIVYSHNPLKCYRSCTLNFTRKKTRNEQSHNYFLHLRFSSFLHTLKFIFVKVPTIWKTLKCENYMQNKPDNDVFFCQGSGNFVYLSWKKIKFLAS